MAEQAPELVSAASTPIPDVTPTALPQDAVAPTDDAAVETPELAPTPEAAPAPPRTPDSYSHEELNQLYREGKLNDPALVVRREDLNQREFDRQRREAQVIAQRRQQEQQNLAYLQSLKLQTDEAIKQAYEAEIDAAFKVGREPDRDLIAERVQRYTDNLMARSRDVHVGMKEHEYRELLGIAYPGADLSRMDIDQLVNQIYQVGIYQGQVQGLGPDSVVKSKTEYEKELKAARDAGYNQWRAENGVGAPPNGEARANGGGSLTPERWRQMSPEQRDEWRQTRPEQIDAMWARANARR